MWPFSTSSSPSCRRCVASGARLWRAAADVREGLPFARRRGAQQHTPTSRLNAQNLPDLEYIISIADQPAPGMLAFNDLLVRRTTPLQVQ